MNNPQMIAEIIEKMAKDRSVSISTMLTELEMNKNALFTMKKSGYLPRAESLCKIADYLGCSVDYLLGRVDTPNGTYSIKGDNNVQVNDNKGDYFTINNSEQPKPDSMIEDFMEVFKTLSFTNKVEAMKFVTDMTKNEV